MASDINSIFVVGRLTKDAELITFDSGSGVLNFSIATNHSYKKNDQWVEEASFIDCKYFSKGASKLSEYMKKGGQIAVRGMLLQERWEKDGQQRSRLVIQVDEVQLLGSRSNGSGNSTPSSNDGFPEDFPFN